MHPHRVLADEPWARRSACTLIGMSDPNMPDEPAFPDACAPAASPRTRSFTEWFFGFEAGETGEGGTDSTGTDLSEDEPDIRSLAEVFFRHPTDTAPPGSAASAAPVDDRSSTERSVDDAPQATNPWRRTADHEDREARAEAIALLVSRWELGTVHRLHALAASFGLDVREFLVLSELVLRPAGLTASQLTGVVGGGAARMSVLLRGLEQRGLVERDPDPFDRRAVVVGASDRAREFLPHRPAPDLRRYVRHEFSGEDRADTVTHFLGVAAAMAYGNGRDLREGPVFV